MTISAPPTRLLRPALNRLVSQVIATKYEVLVEHRFIDQARQLVAAMPRA